MRSPALCNRAPLAGALFALALSTTALTAAAQEPAGAQVLRDKARAAFAAGDTAGACQLFEQSYQASRAPGSTVSADEALFDLADCHEHLGRKEVATAEFDQVATAGGAKAEEAKRRGSALRVADKPLPVAPLPVQPVPPPPPPPPGAVEGEAALPPALLAPGPGIETLTGGPPPTGLGNFMDSRLAWTFGDDDVLHATGLAYPLSQSFNIGDRSQYRLFFDDLNSRFTGRENLTHLALYKKMPGFIRNLDTEASLILRFDFDALASNSNNLNQALYDAGSYIRLFYHTDGNPEGKTGLGLTLWPIDTDRFRLGYLYATSWGGTNAYINQSIFPGIQGTAPGAKLQYDGAGWNVFFGFKTASIVQPTQTLTPGTSDVEEITIQQTNVGLLAGGAVDITENIHIDVNGGFFQQGKFDLPDVFGQSVYTFGGSARLFLHHKDMPVPQSIDFLLYKNDPNKPQIIFKPEVYVPGKTMWQVIAEYDNIFQNLKDFDVPGATKIQPARAASLQANIKSSFFRASLTGIYRDLAYVLRNQPSFIPFETMPAGAQTTPEFFFAATADYYFEGPRLTPGISGGIQLPATFKSTSVNSSSSPIDRTVVVREQGDLAILPLNQGSVPIIEARLSLKWDISRILSAQVWVQYKRDNNATFVERDPSEGTVSLRTFLNPDFLGLGSSVQARF
jgi:tetratricopeptide (TPR) repeat protein